MSRPASFPLPLIGASRRPSRIRCEECFDLGAAVRVDGKLLCGVCFHAVAARKEAVRSDSRAESNATI
jgi:hypothetical protein